MDRANTIIVCIMFGAWIRKIRRTSCKDLGLSGKNYDIAIFCCIAGLMCSMTRFLQENDVPPLHRAACNEFISL